MKPKSYKVMTVREDNYLQALKTVVIEFCVIMIAIKATSLLPVMLQRKHG